MYDEELETEELDANDDADLDADDISLDDVDDVEDVEDIADDSVDDGSDVAEPIASSKSKAASSVEDLPSLEAKQKDRDALAKAMEEFLARGGKVQEVENKIDV